MPINTFGNSSNNTSNKIDTSLFVQKPFIRTNYIEVNIDQDIDLKNQYRINNIPHPINDNDIVSKIYFDNKIVDIIKKDNQNDDYVSFFDNDNVQCKSKKYRPKIQLTDLTLFIADTSGANCTSKWSLFCSTKRITDVFTTRSQTTPISWGTGPGSVYESHNFY